MIDPKLHSLIKVVETGSFTRAAEQLSLTQPRSASISVRWKAS